MALQMSSSICQDLQDRSFIPVTLVSLSVACGTILHKTLGCIWLSILLIYGLIDWGQTLAHSYSKPFHFYYNLGMHYECQKLDAQIIQCRNGQ